MPIDGNFVAQRFMPELCFNIGASGYGNFKNGLKKLTSAINGDGKFNYNDAAASRDTARRWVADSQN